MGAGVSHARGRRNGPRNKSAPNVIFPALRGGAWADTFRAAVRQRSGQDMDGVLRAGVVGAGVFGGYHAAK
jgi:hypothetical protein